MVVEEVRGSEGISVAGDARSVPWWRPVGFGVVCAVLSALATVIGADTARAESGPVAPVTRLKVTPPTTSGPVLRLGSKGPDVLRLHRRLAALRYDVGSLNTTFSDDTLHAVRAFQKVQRLAVSGVVTAAMWKRLAKPVVPRARYTGSAAAVEVDLTKRVLYLARGGTVTAIFDVSPGKPSTPTVTGRFKIYRRERGTLTGMYRSNYFHRGYALHGYPSVPPYSASHGCVRLTPRGMDRLWPRLSIGVRVSIYRR
jgi:N-acetylmuramoyl-L-alanine amidase